jgi:serine phosphatase RsbU (regulator of sigma subunit)
VARAVVPVLGDWAIASLVGEDGRLFDVAAWHADPTLEEAAERYARLRLAALTSTAPIVEALRSGRPMIVDDVPAAVGTTLPPGPVREAFEMLDPRTAVVLSLQARGRTVGALSIYRSGDRPPADADDVATMREVAERVALALDNSRLYEQQRRLAEGLQRSLLTAPPEPENAEIVVRYRPAVRAAEVGGDWYDAFVQPSGSTVVVIGDVVGHDTAAAAAMGQLRGMLRGIAYRDGAGPGAVLTELDAAIEGLGMDTMATAAIARVEQTDAERVAGTMRVRWSNAGHPPPLLIRPDGTIEELSTARAELMLGVDPGTVRTESVVTVGEGATLFLYTDGLVEGRDLPLDDGIARLTMVLAELGDRPLGELCDEVVGRLRPQGLEDDVALVAVRLHGRSRPAGSVPDTMPELVRPRRPAER